ncbi:MAG: T9SS type A sorting domain-containing protein, partial [Dysgonamonadaceae bacterium]|nr:T9SS type A sorting domain-containing protein [Dysgonamonadaceae bacterium]
TYLIEQNTLELSNNYLLTFTPGVLFTIDPTHPRLLQDLEDAVVCAGESYTFAIVAECDNLSYEWYRGNGRITGANRNTCTITNAESGHSDRYYVIVRSDLGSYRSSVYSKEVSLWVASQLPETLRFTEFPSPAITGQTYRIKLAGYPDVTQYVWSYDRDGVTFSPVAGGVGKNETLATFGVLSAGQGLLTVTLEHPCGTRQATQAVLVQWPTGVEQVAAGQVTVSPNPTTGIIKVSGTTSNQIIRIVDITGSLKGTYPAQDGETTIDLSGFTKGTYLVQYGGKTVKAIKK